MRLKEIFKKQGGIMLLKQYWKGGAFFTAVNQFLILGRSRTALEILRLSANLKIRQKLEKQYMSKLIQFDKEFDSMLPHIKSNKVWICWLQGIENAPTLVQKCVQSIQENMLDKEIILITKQNLSQYVQFPDYIWAKWEKGIISPAHFSDLLRLELLINYGGLWLDATVFCTSNNIPDFYFDSDLFFYQSLKPGRDGKSIYPSNWLIGAKTNNKILHACRHMLHKYWESNDFVVDYFIFHHFLSIIMDYYREDSLKVVPRDNSAPHMLLLRLFEPYDQQMWEYIKQQTPFHKLTYKFDEQQLQIEGTYYKAFFGGLPM